MTTPLGSRTVWKSLIVAAGIALVGGAWRLWSAPAPREVDALIEVDVLPGDELTREDILVGMRPIKALAHACHDRFHVPGLVTVEVEISAQGTVTRARAHDSSAGTATDACVERAVTHALFRPSKSGANIVYPFLLR